MQSAATMVMIKAESAITGIRFAQRLSQVASTPQQSPTDSPIVTTVAEAASASFQICQHRCQDNFFSLIDIPPEGVIACPTIEGN
jgi:hypothetical protein